MDMSRSLHGQWDMTGKYTLFKLHFNVYIDHILKFTMQYNLISGDEDNAVECVTCSGVTRKTSPATSDY